MLQTVLDGVGEREHEFEFVFFDSGPWPTELRGAGFRVDVISTGRLRQVHRWMASVFLLTRIIRRRKPDLILNWAGKAQLYGAPATLD